MFDPKPRLLVIDDDPQIRRVYARVLHRDFRIESESDGSRALGRIAEGDYFDVILCDLDLGESISGQDFFESLPVALQNRTVISSATDPAEGDSFATALGDRFFMKLGSVATLIAILLHVVHAGPALPRAAA